jgi:hypothetical protein
LRELDLNQRPSGYEPEQRYIFFNYRLKLFESVHQLP